MVLLLVVVGGLDVMVLSCIGVHSHQMTQGAFPQQLFPMLQVRIAAYNMGHRCSLVQAQCMGLQHLLSVSHLKDHPQALSVYSYSCSRIFKA